jgi:hypothetical protein
MDETTCITCRARLDTSRATNGQSVFCPTCHQWYIVFIYYGVKHVAPAQQHKAEIAKQKPMPDLDA